MAHRILIELSADDPVSMTSERVLKTLKGLSGSGVRVSGVEALDADLFVVAAFLRLALKADPLAGRLHLADVLGRDESLTPAERLAVVQKLEGLLSVEPMPPGAPAFYEGDLGVADLVTRDSDEPARVCKHCRHSKPDTEYTHWEKPGYLVCSSPKWIKGYALDTSTFPPDGIHVEDDEDWAFRVGPDFGCVHFEAR